MIELTPSEKRNITMTKLHGPKWRQVVAAKRAETLRKNHGKDYAKKIGKKAAKTYRANYTPEQRQEIARNAGKIGGKNSPMKFKPGDKRAIAYGLLKKSRAESSSE